MFLFYIKCVKSISINADEHFLDLIYFLLFSRILNILEKSILEKNKE